MTDLRLQSAVSLVQFWEKPMANKIVYAPLPLTLNTLDPECVSWDFADTYCKAFSLYPWNEHYVQEKLVEAWTENIVKNGRTYIECCAAEVPIAGCEFAPIERYDDKVEQLSSNFRGSAWINELWVSPNYQNHGVGRFLLANIEHNFLTEGRGKVALWTKADYAPLNKFYRQLQYAPKMNFTPESDGKERTVYLKNLGVHHD